jgi:hypothetical protein
MDGYQDELDASEFQQDPPPSLTERGLAMLQEIWIAQGRPAKAMSVNEDDDGTWGLDWSQIGDLTSFITNARSASQVMSRLISPGYLHVQMWRMVDQLTRWPPVGSISALGLSVRGFDALIAAGVIEATKPGAKKRRR